MASASLYCPKCGTANESHSAFCSNCGNTLPTAGPAMPYPPDGPTSRSSSSATYPASGAQPPPPPYRTSNMPSSPTYPASGAQSPLAYPMGDGQSSPSYPAGGQFMPPPANPNGDKLPSPPPKPRRGKKIGIIAIIAATVAILLVGAYLAVALLKPSSPLASHPSATATPAPTATQSVATATTAPTATPTSLSAGSPTAQSTTTPVAQAGLPCTVDIGTWAGGSSDWKILNATLLNDGTNSNDSTDNGPTIIAPCQLGNTANYTIEAKIQVISVGYSPCFGITVRGTPSTNNWQGYTAGVGNCSYDLGTAYVGGPDYNNDNNGVQASFNPGTKTHTYRVEVNNNVITYYVDGSLLLTLTDNRYLTGAQVGLWDQGVQLQVTSFSVTAAT